ncbi:hypothetical protein X777_13007 [Ooceraea biroi]|uniref:Uncharacterized protein n=1 Tax=Ooceraea biroi TaxID=2015173 RepID=A0A026VXL3_OOCBI|nr:hypothetical protein X777_13007 [Ooceraea biroi]
MLATTNQCFRTNAVMDEYITELATCLMQEPNVPMWVYGIKQCCVYDRYKCSYRIGVRMV